MKNVAIIPIKSVDGIDDKQIEKIELPIGETVVGRGEKFKCFDKKVSRNHCLLRIFENGNVELTSTHVNPCFHQTADEEWKVIAQNNSILMNNGDKFSLLHDSFQYCLEIIEEHDADNSDLNIQENEKLSAVALDGNQSENNTLPCMSPRKKVARQLPAWMNDSVTSPKRQTDNKETEKKKQKTELSSPSKENVSISLNAGSEKNLSAESDCGQEEINSDHKSGSGDEGKDSIISTAQNKLHGISDESDTESVSVKKTIDTVESEKGQTPVKAEDVSSNASVRQPCNYGQGCYRKNPQHLSDFSHPGDGDYKSDDRPECPYGTACYRKNPVHKQDFKHTQKKPAQKKKRKQKVTPNEDSSDEDDYDYDDPFLNDGSSDDYEPTDSGSDESWTEGEDEGSLKRLRKEARKFTGKKKK